jgi:undecaprenyl-diphosphatase
MPPDATAGSGIGLVVNPGGGSAGEDLVEQVRRALPGCTVRELDEGGDLAVLLRAVAEDPRTTVLGIAGGDGSVSVAASVAAERGLPLLVVPAGTLNHLARDLGIDDVDGALAAATSGRRRIVDLPQMADRSFVNTASFGSYASLVDARERLEGRIGKWPAAAVAAWRVWHREPPIEVELDGRQRRLWTVFIGNCQYEPRGFAPRRRSELADGLLDIRLVDADHRWARGRVILGLLTGRLAASPTYEEWTAASLVVRCPSGPMRLACDGETFDGPAEVEIRKSGRQLEVLVPAAGITP